MSPSYRVAGAGDGPAIATLINAAFRVEDFFIDGDRTHDAEVAALMAAGRFLCAVDDDAGGALLGVIYVQRQDDRGYFGLLSIAPGHQRAGLGRALVAHAEALCRDEGARHMDLKIVNLREELPAYYASLGYRERGGRPFTHPARGRGRAHFVHLPTPLL